MKLMSLFVFSCLLVACGGSSNSQTAATTDLDPNKIYLEIVETASLFDETGAPLAGIPVQLDYNGPIVLSDAKGRVTFEVMDNEPHQIHAIPETGYDEWQSIYNVKKGKLYTIKFYDSTKAEPSTIQSLVSFSGIITNYNKNNKYTFRFYEKNGTVRYSRLSNSNTNADYSVDIGFNYPAGTKVTGQILLQEYRYDANIREEILIDSVIVPKITAVTAETGTNSQQLNVDGLVRGKPPQSNIVTVNAINTNSGFTLSFLNLSSINNSNIDTITKPNWNSVYSYTMANVDLVFPKVFQSYTRYDYQQVEIFVSAFQSSPVYELDWNYTNAIARNSTLTINPLITVFPDFPNNQQGELINWNKVDSNITELRLSISAISANAAPFSWIILLDSKASSVRLPNIAVAQQRLVAGQDYRVNLRGRVKTGKSLESFSLSSRAWTW